MSHSAAQAVQTAVDEYRNQLLVLTQNFCNDHIFCNSHIFFLHLVNSYLSKKYLTMS